VAVAVAVAVGMGVGVGLGVGVGMGWGGCGCGVGGGVEVCPDNLQKGETGNVSCHTLPRILYTIITTPT